MAESLGVSEVTELKNKEKKERSAEEKGSGKPIEYEKLELKGSKIM